MGDQQLPGKGVWGWLGRQVGYVARAVKVDVAGGDVGGGQEKTLYRREQVEEREMPGAPGVVLRRTTTDEVVVSDEEKVARKGSED